MGKISQGILGGVSGKVGNVIGGSWKGIDYLRIKPSSVANPRTEGQVTQRYKFTAALEFLQPSRDFIKVGFKNFANGMTEFNYAMSYILANAVTGDGIGASVNYANALVSKGTLNGALNPTVSAINGGIATITWTDNSGGSNALATDKAMILIYNPVKKSSLYITAGADRNIGTQDLVVPDSFIGDEVHVYFSFISADNRLISNSMSIGVSVVQ
jgi:hypothetical protein